MTCISSLPKNQLQTSVSAATWLWKFKASYSHVERERRSREDLSNPISVTRNGCTTGQLPEQNFSLNFHLRPPGHVLLTLVRSLLTVWTITDISRLQNIEHVSRALARNLDRGFHHAFGMAMPNAPPSVTNSSNPRSQGTNTRRRHR